MMKRLVRLHKDSQGFTLVELMIVVAIIGILAAIAIPNFLTYQMKSKTSEAKSNLGAIKTSQESYRAENDVYLLCAGYPATLPGATKAAWTPVAGHGFIKIGYAPAGNVYYSYGVNARPYGAAVTPAYVAFAQGDLDVNGTGAAAGYTGAAMGIAAADVDAEVTSERAIIVAAVKANDGIFTIGSNGSFADGHVGIW